MKDYYVSVVKLLKWTHGYQTWSTSLVPVARIFVIPFIGPTFISLLGCFRKGRRISGFTKQEEKLPISFLLSSSMANQRELTNDTDHYYPGKRHSSSVPSHAGHLVLRDLMPWERRQNILCKGYYILPFNSDGNSLFRSRTKEWETTVWGLKLYYFF